MRSLICNEMVLDLFEALSQALGHGLHLASDQAQICIFAADEAQDQVVYWLGNVLDRVGRDEEGL